MPEDSDAGRKLRQKTRRVYNDEMDDEVLEGTRTFNLDAKLSSTKYNNNFVTERKGTEVTLKYFQENGFSSPILIKDKTGLGMRVPSANFTVNDVKQCVGSRRMLDVVDVTTQTGVEMTMKEWVKYYENKERDKLLNVISLEFSHTRLETYVEQPTVVHQMDWVDTVWPRYLKECQTESTNLIDRMKYPKVQKYCLMSVAGCYTDFHIDMGGTSVWYHLLHGKKVFWLIPPNEENLDLYENWTLSGKQGDIFFADRVKDCQRIELEAGWTFFIPTGWIHAVYTPDDSLVFGGNFLHSFNINMQLRIWEVESKTHVPHKFRYPFFTEIHWYMLERYVATLAGKPHRVKGEEELKQEKEEEEEDEKPDLECGTSRDSTELEDSVASPNFSPPGSPLEEEHNYVNKSHPQSPVTPVARLIEDNTKPRSPRPTASRDTPDIEIKRKPSHADLIKPVSIKLENCMAGSDAKSSGAYFTMEVGEKPKPWVHLTKDEIQGLRKAIDFLKGLPTTKMMVPKDIPEPELLLSDALKLVNSHCTDDEVKAATGDPVIKWPARKKTKRHRREHGHGLFAHRVRLPKSAGSGNKRHRRTRCKKCEPCTRKDCGECHFCGDMKKFGGPGRMKQSCISRQCLAPELPGAAVCSICEADELVRPEEGGEPYTTLMECCVCWGVLHPKCLKEKSPEMNEGNVNEDFPNSWECPKCHQPGKDNIPKIPRPMRTASLTPRQQTPSRRSSATCSDASESTTKDSDEENKQTPQVKRGRPKGSRNKIKAETDTPTPPKKIEVEKVEVEKVEVKVEVEAEKVEVQTKRRGRRPREENNTELIPLKRPKLEITAVTSANGKPTGSDTSFTPSKLSSQLVHSDTSSPSPNKVMRRPSQSGSDENLSDSSPSKRMTSRGRQNDSDVQSESAPTLAESFLPMEDEVSVSPHPGPSARDPGGDYWLIPGSCDGSIGEASESGFRQEMPVVVPKYVVRPAPVPPPPKYVLTNQGNNHVLDRTIWTCVFHFLNFKELAKCMEVNTTWYRWCLDHHLWRYINLRGIHIQQSHLVGIVKRQPKVLDLAWTNISRRQLWWLIPRLPHLKELNLSGNSWASVNALCSSSCPLLWKLDLSWVQGIHDDCIHDLISPPADHRPGVDESTSRLSRCHELSLAGSDITDAALDLIVRFMPRLQKFDLNYCSKLTDKATAILSNSERPASSTLTDLDVTGCNQLTDACLGSLGDLTGLQRLTLVNCHRITLEGCQSFIQRARFHSFVMMEERRIHAV